MNILITGARGFIGKNLLVALKNIRDGKDKTRRLSPDLVIWEYGRDTCSELLDEYCSKADFVFNLAGVNRPKAQAEFTAGNSTFVSELLDKLEWHANKCPVMLASSIQAGLETPYGRSKKAGEDILLAHAAITGASALIYRFPNVFGKWCRPNYNSAIATFCYNITRDLPITVNDPSAILNLAYIDDVIDELIHALEGNPTRQGVMCVVPVTHTIQLGTIVKVLQSFKNTRDDLSVPDMAAALTKKLYATYLSYLPENKFSYPLKMKIDPRGSFTEVIRTADCGQFSGNILHHGIIKGTPWHNTKNEKFLVVSGFGVIRFRRIGSDQVQEYFVSGGKLEVVDIPPGYTHNIENLGDADMVTFMWCNECFDPTKPDTYFEEV